ncbi:hypothetical protein RclHR1_07240008 [Rhizophagus clarus]|uniref:Uncharacterized protein n=1 Tax=Rhizophagus clarus TaxID=94130 RepID=A0A2Z6SKK2_9GLOM|nr:hypothetical protein RclHR1_07240008 [Rhizophagus clarus]GES91776.1 hypothetical protein RCL_jg14015.t1 [Rhizophagus clarus]
MSDKPLPQIPKDEKEKSLNESYDSSSLKEKHLMNNDTKQVEKSNHPHLAAVKEVLSDAVHHAAQTLKVEPKESHPEAYHQDGQSGPE